MRRFKRVLVLIMLFCAGAVVPLMAQIDSVEEQSALDDSTSKTADSSSIPAEPVQSPFVTDTVHHMMWLGPLGFSFDEPYEQIATVEFGMNLYPSSENTYQNQYALANVGTVIALAFPVRFTGVRTYYKAKAIFHDAALGSRSDTLSYFYFYAINEIVLGKTLTLKFIPFNLIPQLGVGLGHGLILANRKNSGLKGTTNENYAFHFNIGVLLQKTMKVDKFNLAFGAQIMFEQAFKADDSTERRLNFCIVISD